MRWDVPQEAKKLAALRRQDSFHETRARLALVAEAVGEWAGIPVPVDGQNLVVAPEYVFAAVLNGARAAAHAAEAAAKTPNPEYDNAKIRNQWWSTRIRGNCILGELANGKIVGGAVPAGHHFGMDIATMGCSVAWGIEQERNALQTLSGMLRHHTFKMYLLTGMFLEKSERSGLMYIFRKLRPTIAATASWPWYKTRRCDSMRILTCLCMHPIGFYEDTWAGAMCPTDDVIAHLALMRSDEHLYWKRCNHIPPWMPNAGL